jgi:hypothetical protein
MYIIKYNIINAIIDSNLLYPKIGTVINAAIIIDNKIFVKLLKK